MRARAFQPPDAPVRIFYPNQRLRREGEDEQVFLERIMADVVRKVPSLRGLPWKDIDPDTLPKTRTLPSLVDGASPENVRRRWRLRDDKVMIEESIIESVP